jgi:uncharacterized lipoprotein YajG
MKKYFLGLVALCILAGCAARPAKNPSTSQPPAPVLGQNLQSDYQCDGAS